MRTILLLLLMMAAPAMAQRKLWTWTSPLVGDPAATGALHVCVADAKGYSCLILGELKDGEGSDLFKRYRVVWLAPTGNVLHEETIPAPEYHDLGAIWNMDTYDPWKVLALSSRLLVFTNGKRLYKVTVKGVSKQRTETEVAASEFVATGPVDAFKDGWFEMKIGATGEYAGWSGQTKIYKVTESVSLWSAK